MILKKHFTKKLNNEQRLEICQLIGTLHTNSEIQKFIKDRWNIEVTCQDLYQYRRSEKWKGLIKKTRDEYVAHLENIPLSNKVKRVYELAEAFERAKAIEVNSEIATKKLLAIDRQVDVLNQIQKEMEPKTSESTNNYFVTQVNKFESMSREEFDQYRLGLVDKIRRLKGFITGGENNNAEGTRTEIETRSL